jgi:3-dehydroquinate synthase/2-deoxy-scyllo-inosose synthase
MESLSFVFADRVTVPGFLGCDVQSHVLGHIEEMKADKILLVTESVVDELHGDYFAPLMGSQTVSAETGAPESSSDDEGASRPKVEKFVLPSGDAAKSWDHLSALIRWNFSIGATKKSVVVAFGGGALLNVAGLFASIAYRGMKLVYVPTTFLAMHDVVTSLKTSICFDGRKNNIGSFYAPLKILLDVGFCRTLPKSELMSGLGELAKNAALFGGKHAQGFVAALSKESIDTANAGSGEEFSLDDETMFQLVRLGIEAKMTVLAKDAYEKQSGMVFEYGHTVSHAIEKAYGDGTIPHGLGVTYGMLSSSFAAEKMGIMTAKARKEHDDLCSLLVCRWPLPEPKPTVETVMTLAMRDSKRGITNEDEHEISDVLLHAMGDIVPTSTSMLSKFPSVFVREWLVSMGFPSESGSPADKLGFGLEADAVADCPKALVKQIEPACDTGCAPGC